MNIDNSCFICKDSFSNIKLHSQQQLICDGNVFIENCLLYDLSKKGNCSVCKEGYLPGDGNCVLVADATGASLFNDCEIFTYGRCKKCNTGFVRTLDGKECVSIAGLDAAKTDIVAGK